MENSKIYFNSNTSQEIGCKVVLWNQNPNYSFYTNSKFRLRNSDEAYRDITQCVYHHTVTYNAAQAFRALVSQNLSVNFIIEDDMNEDGCATIYQCLMIKDIGFSHKPLNHKGPGVEICYRPEAWQNKNLYSEENIKRNNVRPHELVKDNIHNMNLNVFAPTRAQLKSSAKLAFGISRLVKNVKLEFPKSNGNYIKTTISNPENYSGLLHHFNITRNKIDPAGFDTEFVEWLAIRHDEEFDGVKNG